MRNRPSQYLLLAVLLGLGGSAVLQADDFSSDIAIELFRPDNSPVLEGDTVSGTLRGQITVHNSMMQHAQFYKNFRILIPDEAGQLIDSNEWVRTFALDTSEFYDGENLISVHVHSMNMPGTPYIADFAVQAVKIVTANGQAAPSGDVQLPTMTIDPTMMLLLGSSLLDSKSFYPGFPIWL